MKRRTHFLPLVAIVYLIAAIPFDGQQPSPSMDGSLPRSSPEAEGVYSDGILSFVEALERDIDAVHSIMLVRHGKVVAEGWWSPYEADDPHVMYSVSKSFNVTAVGLAAGEGLLDIHDRVIDHFPELLPQDPALNMRNMRITDLMTMSSGHQNDTMDRLKARADGQWTRAFLETDVEHRPGTHFVYNSGASYMLSAVVQKVTGMTVHDYLLPRLFEPLGIRDPLWGVSPEGVTLGPGGIYVRTEDLAKLGQLYLQKGMWNGKRILPAGWVDIATALHTSSGSNPDSNWDHGYGYQFWQNKVTGYRADGAMGQFSFVLPEYDVVLAVTSGTSDMNGVMNLVWKHLLPALADKLLPENEKANAKLSVKLASLSLAVPATGESALSIKFDGRSFTFGENAQGIASVGFDFQSDNPSVSFEDVDGKHVIPFGYGRWERGRTNFKKRVNDLFDTPNHGIAAAAAWTAEDVFTSRFCFHETPYTLTANFQFTGDSIYVDMAYNIRWGDRKFPRLMGVLAR